MHFQPLFALLLIRAGGIMEKKKKAEQISTRNYANVRED